MAIRRARFRVPRGSRSVTVSAAATTWPVWKTSSGLAFAFGRAPTTVRPGITGWAQVQYKYGNTLDDAREKLQYDLFYLKNASIGLDILIMFQTIKIVLLGRGAQ